MAVAAGLGRLVCVGRRGYVLPPGGWTGRAGGVDQGGEDVQPCGRSNPREAKRSHNYPRKRADRTLRPPPRGLLTLVLLPLNLK